MQTDYQKQFKKLNHFSIMAMGAIFAINIYFFYYGFFESQGFHSRYTDSILYNISKTGFFNNPYYSRIAILILGLLFVAPDNSKKDENANKDKIIYNAVFSSIIIITTGYFYTYHIIIYSILFMLSLLYLLKSFSKIGSLMSNTAHKDRYNLQNKIFKQMEYKVENDTSVNIPFTFIKEYKYDQKNDDFLPIYETGYINIVAPNRATMILGKPGSGKSYSFNEEFLRQHIMKGFSILNYDYKFPTLTNVCYNYLLKYQGNYEEIHGSLPEFGVINLDQPKYSHRCNPISRNLINKKSEAIDAVYTIFFNIDKKSAQKPDFFLNSAMVITSAALWFLREYEDGKYLSLPHLIEFIQRPDNQILRILDDYEDLRYFTSAFSDALKKQAFNQLAGQTASARIPLGKLVTDEMFYVMTDPDGTGIDLRINRKERVTILNIANNPETQKTNGPGLGLYMSQVAKLINAQGRVPCNFHVDELPTIYINGLDNLIATGRSNGICTTLALQDYTQLVRDYGKEIADGIFTTVGNIMCGQVNPETGSKISKMVGKINYKKVNISETNDNKVNLSYSTQKDFLVEDSDLAQLSQGDFVGVVSDTFKDKLPIKIFKGKVSPSKEDLGNEHIPIINEDLTDEDLKTNRLQIQNDISVLINDELKRIQKKEQELMEEQAREQEKELQELENEEIEMNENDIDLYEDNDIQNDFKNPANF